MPLSLESRVRALPCWRGAVTVEPLGGGLSNANFKVFSDGRAYVARLGADAPAHHVFRAREAQVSLWAHAAGLSPAVVYSGDGALVCDYVEGRVYGAAEVRADLDRVAGLIARCHRDMARHASGPATMFWVFHVLRDYARTLRDHDQGDVQDLAAWMRLAEHLEAAQKPLPIVFGHHDLLPANFIADDRRLWLIDWEYAGFGTAMFDLANVAANSGLDADAENALLAKCLGPVDAGLRRSFAAMKVASAMREMLWARVSETVLAAPGVDYADYARQCRTKFEAEAAAYQSAHGAGS